MKSNLRMYFVSAALLAATAAHAESDYPRSASVGINSLRESAARQVASAQPMARPYVATDGSQQGGSGETERTTSTAGERTVIMRAADPSDPSVQRIWTSP